MKSPLVSVIVPNYNHAPYLKDRLESIIHQKYQHYEIILLDDCSHDSSVDILNGYTCNPKVKYLNINASNSGSPFSQWQKGLEVATGELIWFAESDDIAAPTFLDTLVDIISKDDEINLVYCQSNEISNTGKVQGDYANISGILGDALWNDDFVIVGREFIRRYFFAQNIIPNASAVLMRRASLNELPWEYLRSFRYAGDWLIYIMILQRGKIAFVNQRLNNFRSHTHSTRSSKGIEEWKAYFAERNLIFDYIEKNMHCDCSNEYRKSAKMLYEYISLFSNIITRFKSVNDRQIVIYGAGGIGRYIFDILADNFSNIEIVGFIDQKAEMNPSLFLCGKKVMSLDSYVGVRTKPPILIGSITFAEEIKHLLEERGLARQIIEMK